MNLKWFPNQPLAVLSPQETRARLIAFHSAGSDSSLFLSSNIRKERVPNELTEFCKEYKIQLLCPLLPGRSSRHTESVSSTTMESLAREIYSAVEQLLVKEPRPYFLAAHSMGNLILFNFLKEAVKNSAPLPEAIFLTASVSPCRSVSQRPWKPAVTMSAVEFKESLRRWNVAEEVLHPRIWPAFEKMIWQDMDLLDRFAQAKPLDWQRYLKLPGLYLIRGDADPTITDSMMLEWKDAFIPAYSGVSLHHIKGNHAIFYSVPSRKEWNQFVISKVADSLRKYGDVSSKSTADLSDDASSLECGF